MDDNESLADASGQSSGEQAASGPKPAVRKSKSHHALNERQTPTNGARLSSKADFNGSENQVDLNDSNSNLIKILSQNIIELTENLNLLFNEHSNEHGKETASQTKSTETLKDNDLIDKIDQLRKVSKKLQESCTTQQQQTNEPPINETITSLADQLNVVEQVDLIGDLQADKLELEFAECRTTFDDLADQVQINQQPIMQTAVGQVSYEKNDDQPYDQSFDENNNQFNEQNQDRKLRKTASNSSANRLQVQDRQPPQKDESQEDEFYECANEEQKDLRKALFKGSKLNLEQLIDKAIDEQLLGQWLKLSDSLDNEDGPVQQKHSIEELKHKFATKLAIIHYKLYQKYSKTKPINVKKWRHRKLNKCNKIQSKYTLLQGLMDDDQFIQFLMDKISYFMRKIRQSKTQRKELKKSISKADLEQAVRRESEPERKLKQQFEFDQDSLKDEVVLDETKLDETRLDENNNEVPEDRFDENNNEISIDRLDKQANSPSIERELDRLNEIKQELQQEFNKEDLMRDAIKELNEEIVRDLNGELHLDALIDADRDDLVQAKKGSFLSKYALLFLFTLIIFMILIVLFRSLSFGEVQKKCTNCVRNQLDSGQLVLQPVSVQLRQQTAKFLPACDHRIMLEAQKLLGPK